jgi:hypothetical protein
MILARRTLCATLFTLFAGITMGQAAGGAQGAAPRIVAVGDVHGSFEGLTGILQAAGIIDAKQQWAGGTTTFVQTGDIFDRGTGVIQALDLVMRLEGQAKRAGGRVEPLLGNHEVVNILGDLRDVSPAMYAAFADGRSEARRTRAYDDLVRSATRRGQGAGVPARDAWMTAHPAGYIEYTEAVGPRGKYGRWIRSHKVVAVFANTAFMHAGINHTFQGSIADVNRQVADEIAAWDANKEAMVRAGLIPAYATMAETIAAATAEIGRIGPAPDSPETRQYLARLQRVAAIEKSPLLADDGPMWFRGFALWKETDEPAFTALLGRLGIGRFVAGHTPMPQMPTNRNIMNRWNYRIFQIDTGMLGGDFFKGGRPSALEIAGDRITVIYTDSREVVVGGGA